MAAREGEDVEDSEVEQYREAVRRGCKRLAYCTHAKDGAQVEVNGEEAGTEADVDKGETGTEAATDGRILSPRAREGETRDL